MGESTRANEGAQNLLADVVFTRGRPDDAAELAEFAARSFSDAFANDNDPADLAEHLAANYGVEQQSAELADPDVETILARAAYGLVGYAQVRRSQPPVCVTQVDTVELHRFYLDLRMQGSGLATLLMREVQAAAREFGAKHLWLGVWELNPRGIAFYRKVGFEDAGAKIYMVGPDEQKDRVLVARVEPE